MEKQRPQQAIRPVLVAVVTIKATGERYFGYRVESETRDGKSHVVYVRAGHVETCTCEDRVYRHHFCKHMRAMFAHLETAPESFPGKTLADVVPLARVESSKRQAESDQKTLACSLTQQKAPAVSPSLSTKGTLGSNAGFSLMR